MESNKQRCLHYISWHFEVYQTPADLNSIQTVMREFHGVEEEATIKLLDSLVYVGKVSFHETEESKGWIPNDQRR